MNLSSRPVARRAISPRLCGQLFGEHIRKSRVRDGRPLDELAPPAGLTVPEWEAIEAGEIPTTLEQVCLLVEVLYLGRSWKAYLVQLCIGAWEK